MAQIVLFENIHPSARAVFEAAGYTDIVTHAAALPPAELRGALKGAQVAGIRSRTHLDAGLLSDNPDSRRGLLLHRHQPGRPGHGHAAWHPVFNASPTPARSPSWYWARPSCCAPHS